MGKMKQVICIDTGKIYKSAAACEAELDLKQLISRCCNGTATHPDGLVFRYIEDGKIIEPSAAEVAERKERIKEAKDKYNKKRREKKLAERAKAEKRPTPSEPKSEPKKKRLSKAERLALEAKEDQEIAEAIEEMKRDMRYDVPSAKTDVLTELAGEAKKNGEQYGTYAAKVRGDGRLNIVNGHIVRPWEKGE